jgi:hypothetical protein
MFYIFSGIRLPEVGSASASSAVSKRSLAAPAIYGGSVHVSSIAEPPFHHSSTTVTTFVKHVFFHS